MKSAVRAVVLPVLFFVMILASKALWGAPVLLISIDGLRPDCVTEADKYGLRVPNLRRFLLAGSYADGVVGVAPTVTYPSHTTLLTGVWPAEHNIQANLPFDPLMKNEMGWYWYAQDIRVTTLWQAASRAGLVTASLNWPVSVGADGVRFLIPEYWRAQTPDDRKLLEALSRPDGWLNDLEAKLGPYPIGTGTSPAGDETRTRFALEIIRTKHPGFMTIHLTSLDETEHKTGPFSPQSNETIEILDGMVGRLMDGFLKTDPQAVVAVVSDHGFVRTDFRLNLMVPFVQEGLVKLGRPKRSGSMPTLASWDAMPWMAGGTAAIMLRDPNDTALAARVRDMLTKLQANSDQAIARILDKEEIRKIGAFPEASFLVELKPGYQAGHEFDGPLLTPAPSTGMHGYLPDRPDMRASFFLMGKGIQAGKRLGVIDMRQIAPTLAVILDVQFPPGQPRLDVLAR